MGILQNTERFMVRAICGVQLKDRKRSMDLMFMLGLNETMEQLTIANSVRWYGHCRGERMVIVEERGWSCLENGIIFHG